MPEVTILLCGPPRLELAGRSVVLERQKALALVAYLALAPDPVSRDELAALCWPELSQERARAALRTTLPALTTAVPFPWLSADRRQVHLQAASIAVDVTRFRALLAEVRRHQHADPATCGACLLRLREAETLYRGEFLQGFSLSAAPDFEAWQLAQRETLRHEIGWILHRLTTASSAGLAVEDALRYGRRWLELDPLNETAHRALMERYAAAGRRSDALRQYHQCVAVLQSELGVPPAPETSALYEHIVHGADPQPAAVPSLQRAAAGSLPAEPDGFVGRARELAWLLRQLRDPDCRLITLTGPGGIGKTRLAIRATTLLAAEFADGACMAALGDARTVTEALRHIAAAVATTPTSNDPPLQTLQRVLARRNTLIVLDNLEHLPALADELAALLAAAPGLKLLATSRERLALRAEHVLPLEGLALPTDAADHAPSDAVRLFVQRARQVRPDFALDATHAPAVAAICAIVGGMPLGIELAAAWTRTLTPETIAAEIARSPDFLQAAVRDLPVRHRSLRAVFDHSWRLLSPLEQRAFRRLAVFQGGFTAAAAQSVAESSLAMLAALEDKSLIRRMPAERYDFHPLLHQYAAAQLAAVPGEQAAIQADHARYIAAMMQRLAPHLGSGELLATLALESANIRTAWFWAVDAGDTPTLGLMVEGLARFCELRSYRPEAEAALAYAEDRLIAQQHAEPAPLRVLAHIQAWRGHFCQFLGRYDDSAAALERSLAIARRLDDPMLLAFCAKAQGINANAHGEHQRALELQQTSLQLYQRLGDQDGIGEVFNRMGGVVYDMGDLAEAQRCWEASLAAYTQVHDRCGIARALNNLGEVRRIVGDYAESRRLSEASLAHVPILGPSWSISPSNNLGMLARLAGRYTESRRLHERSLAAAHAAGDLRGAINTTFFLGELALAAGDLAAAATHFAASLEQYRALRQRQGVSACLIGLAELALRRGDAAEAVRLAREALTLAEAIAARITTGRALSALGLALLRSGDSAAGTAALVEAEAIFTALGARPDAAIVADRRGAETASLTA